MFDLGRTFLQSVERSPAALAIVDGERRLTYAAWHDEIARVAAGLGPVDIQGFIGARPWCWPARGKPRMNVQFYRNASRPFGTA